MNVRFLTEDISPTDDIAEAKYIKLNDTDAVKRVNAEYGYSLPGPGTYLIGFDGDYIDADSLLHELISAKEAFSA